MIEFKMPKLRKSVRLTLDCLDEEDRLERCLALLEEIGVDPDRIQTNERTGELTFSCCLPNGEHRRGDRNPSANLNWRKLTFKCHGCGEGMGIIEFITTCTGWKKDRAWAYLMDGVNPHSTGYVPVRVSEPQSRHEMSELEPFYLRRHTYLRERGIPEANVIKHEIGYDPVSTRIVIPVFEMEEHSDEVGNIEYERHLVGWQSRSTKDDGQYRISEGMQTGRLLYNEDRFRDPDRSRHLLGIVVVEAPLSVVAKSHLEDVGYGFVATFGGPKNGQYRLLAEYDPLILWFDSDVAGLQDTLKVGEALQGKTNVYVVNNPPQEDVDELEDQTVLDLVEESIPYAQWKHAQAHAS